MFDALQNCEPATGPCTAADIEHRIQENLAWTEALEDTRAPMSDADRAWSIAIWLAGVATSIGSVIALVRCVPLQ